MALRRQLPSRVTPPDQPAGSAVPPQAAPHMPPQPPVEATADVTPEAAQPQKPAVTTDLAAMGALMADLGAPVPPAAPEKKAEETPVETAPALPSAPQEPGISLTPSERDPETGLVSGGATSTESPAEKSETSAALEDAWQNNPPPPPPAAAPEPVAAPVEVKPEQPEPVPAPQPVAETAPQAEPEPVAAVPAPEAPKPAAPAPVPQPVPNAARPDDNNPMRRRPKQPRAFTFTPSEKVEGKPESKTETGTPETPKASVVADTAPVSGVDERLRNSGILPAIPADELTKGLPPITETTLPAEPVTPTAWDAPIATPQTPTSFDEPAAPAANIMADPAPQEAPEPVAATNLPEATEPAPQAAPESSTALQSPEPDMSWGAQPATVGPAAPAPINDWSTGWGSTSFAPEAAMAPPAEPVPTPDLYGSSRNGLHGAPHMPAPEITGQHGHRPHGRGASWQMLVAVIVVVGAVVGAFYLVSKDENSPLQLAQTQIEEAPQSPDAALLPPPAVPGAVSPDTQLFGPDGQPLNPQFGQPGQPYGQPFGQQPASNAMIDFADVPPDEAGRPIVADGNEQIPDDVGFVARLQQAIAEEKARKAAAEAGIDAPTPAVPAVADSTSVSAEDAKAQLQAELAAYRKALAETPAGAQKPKPEEFMGSGAATAQTARASALDAEGAPVQTPNGELLPPPQLSGASAVPPDELYRNNPKNLPIVPEPAAAQTQPVRQLTDFDVAMFTPERERVRIPQGIKPRFTTTDFPQMDVLSFVPGKGIIAYKDGKEGVLLIGEALDGWELLAVNADNAEFKNGRRTQYVTAD